MTAEEAIKYGEEQLEVFGGDHSEFIKVSIDALEKQIPKKPYKDDEVYRCRVCDTAVEYEVKVGWFYGYYRDSFCSECGQAIDWSEEE